MALTVRIYLIFILFLYFLFFLRIFHLQYSGDGVNFILFFLSQYFFLTMPIFHYFYILLRLTYRFKILTKSIRSNFSHHLFIIYVHIPIYINEINIHFNKYLFLNILKYFNAHRYGEKNLRTYIHFALQRSIRILIRFL